MHHPITAGPGVHDSAGICPMRAASLNRQAAQMSVSDLSEVFSDIFASHLSVINDLPTATSENGGSLWGSPHRIHRACVYCLTETGPGSSWIPLPGLHSGLEGRLLPEIRGRVHMPSLDLKGMAGPGPSWNSLTGSYPGPEGYPVSFLPYRLPRATFRP